MTLWRKRGEIKGQKKVRSKRGSVGFAGTNEVGDTGK